MGKNERKIPSKLDAKNILPRLLSTTSSFKHHRIREEKSGLGGKKIVGNQMENKGIDKEKRW